MWKTVTSKFTIFKPLDIVIQELSEYSKDFKVGEYLLWEKFKNHTNGSLAANPVPIFQGQETQQMPKVICYKNYFLTNSQSHK